MEPKLLLRCFHISLVQFYENELCFFVHLGEICLGRCETVIGLKCQLKQNLRPSSYKQTLEPLICGVNLIETWSQPIAGLLSLVMLIKMLVLFSQLVAVSVSSPYCVSMENVWCILRCFLRPVGILLVYLDDHDYQQMLTLPVSHIFSCSSSNFETKLKGKYNKLIY